MRQGNAQVVVAVCLMLMGCVLGIAIGCAIEADDVLNSCQKTNHWQWISGNYFNEVQCAVSTGRKL